MSTSTHHKGPDMRVSVAGVDLRSPVIAASGTFGYGIEFEEIVSLERIGAFVTKGLSREPMAGNAGIERVLAEEFAPLQQAESQCRHDQMQESRHPADRAVAIQRLDPRRRINLEAHAPAMAAAAMGDKCGHPCAGKT